MVPPPSGGGEIHISVTILASGEYCIACGFCHSELLGTAQVSSARSPCSAAAGHTPLHNALVLCLAPHPTTPPPLHPTQSHPPPPFPLGLLRLCHVQRGGRRDLRKHAGAGGSRPVGRVLLGCCCCLSQTRGRHSCPVGLRQEAQYRSVQATIQKHGSRLTGLSGARSLV